MKISVIMTSFNTIPPLDPHADPSKFPRLSAPMSFLTKGAFFAALALLCTAFVYPVAADVNPNCVCNYDENKDYFPVKLSAQYSSRFTLEYFKHYKKITALGSGEPVVMYAYLCGTPQPSEATAQNSIQIPVDSVALTSTTFLPLMNYIGKANAISYVSTDQSTLSACMKKMALEGKLADGYNMTKEAKEIISVSVQKTAQYPDIVVSDDYGFSDTVAEVAADFGQHTKTVLVPQTLETSALGTLEWMKVMAAYLNAEPSANYVMSSIEARYNCVKNLVATNPPLTKKKVLWGSFYSGKYGDFYMLASCPHYYCQMIADAGGEILLLSGTATDESVLALAEQADVWIYTDGNFLQTSGDGNPPFISGVHGAKFVNTTVVKNKQVFDVLGGTLQDWFDNRIAEPDVLLMDLVQALWGATYISPVREKRFLRNVYTETAASQAPSDAATCTDENAPMYTDWLTGPCFTSAQGDLGGIDQVLCSPGSANLARPSWILASAVLAVAIGFGAA